MSAIIDRIEIPLTAKQHKAIKKFYEPHKYSGAAMLAVQPLGNGYRQIPTKKPFLRCVLLDSELTDAIQNMLKIHRSKRP